MGVSNKAQSMTRRRKPEKAIKETNGATSAEKRSNKTRLRLVKFEELPEFLQDNEFIRDHYRSEWPIRDAILSIFSWHNESLNVWTHLGGFLFFLWLTVAKSSKGIEEVKAVIMPGFSRFLVMSLNASWDGNITDPVAAESILNPDLIHKSIPEWPVLIFLMGAMSCLSISATSHLLACHSPKLNLLCWRMDYSGISFMIVSSFFPPLYYAFYCHPAIRQFYLTTISLLGIFTTLSLLTPSLSSPQFRPLRAALFLCLGFSGIIPAARALWINWEHATCHLAIGLELVMAAAYAVGAGFYVNRIPEKWSPGKYDLVGHSHQIFHVFVIFGAVVHYAAIDVLLNWRNYGGPGASCNVPTVAV